MKAPVGAFVRLYYDGEALGRGDALRTPTGRTYEVCAVRLQRRGKRAGRRQHLVCLVVQDPHPHARVLPLHWYHRNRRRRPT